MPPRIPFVIGMVALLMVQLIDARRPRTRLPMPTSETIPYVAEVMGATSYEESVEEGGEVKRVQRKLSGPEHKEPDLDREEEIAEYQGVIGRPGVDFPVLPSIPRTDFSCRNVKSSGYYADLDTGCQVFHICDGGRKISFLCPNGTIFRQSHLICDWWFRVDCERSVELYEESAEQLAHDQMVYKKRAEDIAKAMTVKATDPPKTASTTQQRPNRRNQRPQQQYTPQPPQQQYNPPQQQYNPPQKQYNPPQKQYNPPQKQYNPPQKQFTSRQQQYSTSPPPLNQYKPRQKQYSTSPPQQYTPQKQQYNTSPPPPVQQYNSPQQQYSPPLQQKYTPPPQQQQYTPPPQQQQYTPPPQQQQYSSLPQQQQYTLPPQQEQYNPSPHQEQYNQLPHQEQEEQEHERQIPAETASFAASNRHRFANQLEDQYKQQFTATTTSTTTPYPNSEPENIYNYDGQRYQTTKTTPHYSPANFEEFYSNKQHNKEQHNTEEYRNEELINNNYPGSVYSSYNYSYQNADFYNNNSNYSNNYNFSSIDYDSNSSLAEKYTKPEVNSDIKNYYGDNHNQEKASGEYKSKTPYTSTTVRSFTNSAVNLYNDQTQRHDNYQQVFPSTTAPLKQKTIFDVKIKPTKDFAYVELLRHEEKLNNQAKSTTPAPAFSSSSPTYQNINETTSSSLSDDVFPVSHFATPSPSSSQPSTRHTYLPTKATKSQYQTTATPATNRYASIQVSGTSEEIRPEIVNSLMESGVTPTSAKALHSLATYISSGAADDLGSIYGQSNSHPHVSDVILNFHSGTPVTNAYSQNEVTTHAPSSAIEESLPAVLTKATKESYSYLFSEDKSKEHIEDKSEEPIPFLEIDYTTQKPKATTIKTIKGGDKDIKLKDSSELRELAQVFSRALSAYLEDPETFKEILAQVRPTEPSNIDHTTPSIEDEVLDFSDANQGRKGTTGPPITTIGNISGLKNENLNIGEINNLANGGQTFEPDNSLEHTSPLLGNTFPPTAPEDNQQAHFTSVTPITIQSNVNSISNYSDPFEFFSKLGSKEDQSYFPTLGGVSDTSRPRYGGFQNNTQKNGRTFAPYGADIPRNLTGAPISITTPFPQTTITLVASSNNNSSETSQGFPQPNDINSLIKNNVLNSDHTSSEENLSYQTSPSAFQEDTYYPAGDQEKVLITSGSQSIVSSNNYLQFAKNFNEQSQKEGNKYYPALYSSNSYLNYAPSALSQESGTTKEDYNSEEFIPYFGQEPPFENLAKPSGFQTTKESDQNSSNDSYEKPTGIFADPINYHIGTINEELVTPSYNDKNSEYKVSYKNIELGNGVTLEKHESSTEPKKYEASWTVSPLIDLTTAVESNAHFNHSSSPVSSSSVHYLTTQQFEATTYRPQRSTDSSEPLDFQWGNTAQTENSSEETVTTTSLNNSAETVKPNEPVASFEKTAMDMFGNLNESAAVTLMDMMTKAENNMTIRRLVLLLVNEKGKENRTVQESRENLINALLSNMEETTPQPSLSGPPSIAKSVLIPRKKVRVSRVRVSSTTEPSQSSAKFYRGTDSDTAVHGSVQQSPSDISKLNSAKLYIPSPSVSEYTNTLPIDSDARAVELLRTLYSLAAKWG